MLSNRQYREFALELDDIFRKDPAYASRKQKRILTAAARGERIVRFEDRYVISSFVPPIPSRAFKTFVTAGIDRHIIAVSEIVTGEGCFVLEYRLGGEPGAGKTGNDEHTKNERGPSDQFHLYVLSEESPS